MQEAPLSSSVRSGRAAPDPTDPTQVLDSVELLPVEPAEHGLEPGVEAGGYLVGEALGHGGMADVFEAEHRSLGTRCALKVARVSGPGLGLRLLQEARVQALLDHPNVVRVTDVFELPTGEYAVAMELVRGTSLTRWLRARPACASSEWVPLFLDVVRGVQHAHEHGIVHRDIKPSNVLVHQQGSRTAAKLCDFGIAKVLADASMTPCVGTNQGTAMGTVGFTSPEQLYDAASVDQRADVFSLGCLLYYIVAGDIPFRATTRTGALNQIMRGPPAWLGQAGLPPAFVELVEGLVQADREHRLADCQAILDVMVGIPLRSLPNRRRAPIAPAAQAHTVLRPRGQGQGGQRIIPTVRPFGYDTPLPL